MIYIDNDNFNLKNTVVSLGNFDGIHLGHQKLIQTTTQQAKNNNSSSVVFSFFPHPKSLLTNKTTPMILTSSEKRYLFEQLNVDFYIEYPFTHEFSKLTPTQFFEEIIVKKLDCKILIIGEGYRFGAGKQGNANFLKNLCEKHNIKFIVIKHLNYNEVKISSSNIRELILTNQFQLVEHFLTRPYFIKGTVINGKKIGNTIGFPTANIITNDCKLIPSDGIFITKTTIDNTIYRSITNIGKNPTVDGKIKTIETFIFDFNYDIYEKDICVMFYKKIRDEIKFNNIDELKNQIAKDRITAENYFKLIHDKGME